MIFNEIRLNESLLTDKGSKTKQSVQEALDNIKKKQKEGKLVPADFNQVVHALYRIPPDQIVTESYNVFHVIRFAIFVGVPFLVHPALGLIGWLTNKIIEEKVNEKYEKNVLSKYRHELEQVEKELKKSNLTDDEKDALKAEKRYLDESITKLERYFQGLKKYKEPLGTDSKKDDDDFDDFNFHESTISINGGSSMIFSDDQLTEEMTKRFNEAMEEFLIVSEQYENLSESKVRHAVRTAYSKAERINKRSSDKIDSVADVVRDGGEKNERNQVRQEILDNRLKVSTVVKRAVAIGTAAAINPAIAALGAFIWLKRKGKIKNRQRDQLLAELKGELEILNEKIKDAESDNDKQKKYQYMRMRREVRRSIDRLRYKDTLRDMDH